MTAIDTNKTDPIFTHMVRHFPSYLKIIFVLLASAALFSGGSLTRAAGSKIAAPDWNLSDVDGKPVKLSDFKGKVVILDFWATWCPPCRAEIPGFVAIQKKYADTGFTVIGVSLDKQGISVVKPFMSVQGSRATKFAG
jgi:thiol-disulfide isomerase/thioredoxin